MGIKEERHTNNNDGIYTMKKKKRRRILPKWERMASKKQGSNFSFFITRKE